MQTPSPVPATPERSFIAEVEGLDVEHLGDPVGIGAQHLVMEYRDADVVKLPLAAFRNDFWSKRIAPLITPDHETMKRDVGICEKNFKEFVVPTEVHEHTKSTAYALLQPRLALCDYQLRHHLHSSVLREQLLDILKINVHIRKKLGMWLDLMGYSFDFAWKKPRLMNVSVADHSGKTSLCLHDLTLYHAPRLSLRGIQGAVLLAVQRWQLSRFEEDLTM